MAPKSVALFGEVAYVAPSLWYTRSKLMIALQEDGIARTGHRAMIVFVAGNPRYE
jgi:hypothetical protein